MPVYIRNKGNTKPVLIFKHSEAELVSVLPKNIQQEISRNTFCLTYFGYYMNRRKAYFWERAWITLPNTVKEAPRGIPVLEFAGANFLPKPDLAGSPEFLTVNRSFVVVTNDTFRKGLCTILMAIIRGKRAKFDRWTIVCQRTASSSKDLIYSMLVSVLVRRIEKKSSKFQFIWVDKKSLLPRRQILELLASSQFLVLSSRAEGAARVLGEAHLCKTRVILRKKMKGSTGLLASQSDVFFGSGAGLSKILDEIVYKEFTDVDVESANNKFLTLQNQKRFERCLGDLYLRSEKQVLDFDDNLDLTNLLSCHQARLPRNLVQLRSGDEIYSEYEMIKFLTYIGLSVRPMTSVEIKAARLKRKLKAILRKISSI